MQGKTITVGVGTNAHWPPYEFFARKDGIISDRIEGFSVDVLAEILAPYGVHIRYEFYPWKRCLENLEHGELVQLLLPTSLNQERRNRYLFSESVYDLSPAYYYLAEDYPDGLSVTDAEELHSLGLVCGLRGYNYKNFGIDNDRVDRGASSYSALLGKLRKRRCAAILARHEILVATHAMGEVFLSSDIQFDFLPNVAKERFHFLVTKNHPLSETIVTTLNEGLERMRKSGRLDEMLRKYTCGSFTPWDSTPDSRQ